MVAVDLLPFTRDHFGGVIVEPGQLPSDPDDFAAVLRRSLDAWKGEGMRLAWMDVPIQQSALITIAVQAGFIFHHSDEDSLTVVARLVEGAFIPTHATHYIGVGGVVLNAKGELLVVCERHRRTSRIYYKLPGGALQPGEHMVDAVLREVEEETGVLASFDALVCFRHWHGYRYGKSDIYFVCRLKAQSEDITMQASEIEECFWMPLDEYYGSEYVSPFNKRIVRAALESKGVMPEWVEGYEDPSRYEIFLPQQD